MYPETWCTVLPKIMQDLR